jgi:hypothetical protein
MIQEDKTQNLNTIPYYTAHVNQGVEDRGTAILNKEGLIISNLIRLPSGSGIAAPLQGTYIINVYASSGGEKRGEREDFYNNEVPKLLPKTPTETVLAGAFNCILENNNSTGNKNFSRALECMVQNPGFHDVWQASDRTTGFTYYGTQTDSRLDRIHVTKNYTNKREEWKFWRPPFRTTMQQCYAYNRYTATPSWKKLLENERDLSTGKQLTK